MTSVQVLDQIDRRKMKSNGWKLPAGSVTYWALVHSSLDVLLFRDNHVAKNDRGFMGFSIFFKNFDGQFSCNSTSLFHGNEIVLIFLLGDWLNQNSGTYFW